MDGTLSLVSEGGRLSAIGMGTVFVFLTLLVAATSAMSWLVSKFSPQPALRDEAVKSVGVDRARLIAIMTAAIHAHRARNRDHDRKQE